MRRFRSSSTRRAAPAALSLAAVPGVLLVWSGVALPAPTFPNPSGSWGATAASSNAPESASSSPAAPSSSASAPAEPPYPAAYPPAPAGASPVAPTYSGSWTFATPAVAGPSPRPSASAPAACSPSEDPGHLASSRIRATLAGSIARGADPSGHAFSQAGAAVRARYAFGQHYVVFAGYSLSRGTVTERLPGATIDLPARPNELPQTQTRHTIDAAVGWKVNLLPGTFPLWVTPFAGPRVLLMNTDASPLSALQLDLGARASLWSHDSAELAALLAYAPSLAHNDAASVHGSILSSWRWKLEASWWARGPLGFTAAYEGDRTALQFGHTTNHQAFLGLTALIP